MLINELCQRWTPQQALAVYECLEQLMQTIWSHHEDELCKIFAAECLAIPEPPESGLDDEFDDAIPFENYKSYDISLLDLIMCF